MKHRHEPASQAGSVFAADYADDADDADFGIVIPNPRHRRNPRQKNHR
jgi:hypothetical protein